MTSRRAALPVAIIGAGLAGLAAGRRLAELGIDFEIFESGNGPGGRLRSDRIGEYICDRGFQLVNLDYPDLKRFYSPDEFHRASKSIDVIIEGGLYRLGDPRESLSNIISALNPATGAPIEKLKFLKFLHKLKRTPNEEMDKGEDQSFEEMMVALGMGSLYTRVLRPFAEGVFLDKCDQISAKMANRLIRYFINGTPGLPIGGVSTMALELAKGLPINFDSHVDEIGTGYIRIGRSKRKVDRIVLATDAVAAKFLIDDSEVDSSLHANSLDTMTMSSSTTWYHALDDVELDATLRIDGQARGPITNSIAISKLAPEYAPSGKTLIASTVIGPSSENVSESRVRKHLALLWGMETEEWALIAKYAIKKSLPHHHPGKPIRSALSIGDNIVVAGDHLSFPSQQGALESGIAAAERIAIT